MAAWARGALLRVGASRLRMGGVVLEIRLCGGIELRQGDRVIRDEDLGGRRVRSAMAVLVLERRRAVTREELAGELWPHELPDSWATALRVVVSKVRAAFDSVAPGSELTSGRGTYQLHLPEVAVDVEKAQEAARRLATAGGPEIAGLVDTVRAVAARPFLPDVEGPWVDSVRTELRELFVGALEVQALHGSVPAGREAVALEPLRESAHRALMQALVAGGNRSEALLAYDGLQRLLADELGTSPSRESEDLYLALLADPPPALPLQVLDDSDRMRRQVRGLMSRGQTAEGAELALRIADAFDDDLAAEVLADAAWDADAAGDSVTAFRLAAVGVGLTGSRRDHVWGRLHLLDWRRQEADDPEAQPVPIDGPDRRLAARLVHAEPALRGDYVWAVFDDRDDVLRRGADDPNALLFFAGRYREALRLYQRGAAVAEARGRWASAVHQWAGASRCANALGHPDEAERLLGLALRLVDQHGLTGPFVLQAVAASDDLEHALGTSGERTLELAGRLSGDAVDRSQRWAGALVEAATARIFARGGHPWPLANVVTVLGAAPAWGVGVTAAVSDVVEASWLLRDMTVLPELEALVEATLGATGFRSPFACVELARARLADLRGHDPEPHLQLVHCVADEDASPLLRTAADEVRGAALAAR